MGTPWKGSKGINKDANAIEETMYRSQYGTTKGTQANRGSCRNTLMVLEEANKEVSQPSNDRDSCKADSGPGHG